MVLEASCAVPGLFALAVKPATAAPVDGLIEALIAIGRDLGVIPGKAAIQQAAE